MPVASPRRLPGIRFERRAPTPAPVLPRMDVAAFVGIAAAGPLDTPVAVEDEIDFAALFGADAPLAWDAGTGTRGRAYLGPAVRAFFRNGGRRCWVVRVAGDCAQSDWFEVPGLARLGPSGIEPAQLQARSEGSWADGLRVTAALEASTLALRSGDGATFTFSGDVAAGDLLRLTTETEVLLVSAAAAHADGTVTAGATVRLLREPPAPGASGRAAYRDAAGRPQSADATVGTSGRDRIALELTGEAPAEGSLLRLDLGTERIWVTVDDVSAAGVAGALSRPASPTPAVYGPETLAERLTFELGARRGDAESGRLAELGFVPGHPRFAGDLPTDLDLFRTGEGTRFEAPPALWSAAATPRFPLAGVRGDPAVLIPIGMPVVPTHYTGPLAPDGPELVRDGLAPFDDRLFIDDALRDDGTRSVLASADALRLDDVTPRRLRGIHALIGLDEPTIVAVPDAMQRRWRPADDPDVPAPDAIDPLFRPEWWRFLPCTPPRPDDPTAVPISAHYLCTRERIPGSPALSATAPAHGGFELRWTPVAVAGVAYVLEEATEPDWADATASYRGPATRRRISGHVGTTYLRVRAEVGDASTDWSNPVTVRVEPRTALAVPEPESGHFLACDTRVLAIPELADVPAAAGGSYTVGWTTIEPGAVYVLEEATRADWSDARELYRGAEPSLQLFGRPPGVYYYRVRAEVGGLSSDWSAGRAVLVTPAVRWEREPADAYTPDTLFSVQRALMRLCAARGDLFAVLGLPGHYREDAAIAHARALTAGDPLDDDERTRSFAALYHPWLTVPEADDPQAFRVVPPDGAAAGVMAARAARRGAWIAPANEMLRDVVLLDPKLRREALAALQEAQVNVVRQEPRGFLWLSADTLSPDADLRPIGVRRLLTLVRRAALRAGAGYVFEPNDDVLRRAVQRGFEALLGLLFTRGAFTGATADEAFRVEIAQSGDAARLVVELKVAPAQPLAFLTVRLVQAGDGTLTVESR